MKTNSPLTHGKNNLKFYTVPVHLGKATVQIHNEGIVNFSGPGLDSILEGFSKVTLSREGSPGNWGKNKHEMFFSLFRESTQIPSNAMSFSLNHYGENEWGIYDCYKIRSAFKHLGKLRPFLKSEGHNVKSFDLNIGRDEELGSYISFHTNNNHEFQLSQNSYRQMKRGINDYYENTNKKGSR